MLSRRRSIHAFCLSSSRQDGLFCLYLLSPWERIKVRGQIKSKQPTLTPALSQRAREQTADLSVTSSSSHFFAFNCNISYIGFVYIKKTNVNTVKQTSLSPFGGGAAKRRGRICFKFPSERGVACRRQDGVFGCL